MLLRTGRHMPKSPCLIAQPCTRTVFALYSHCSLPNSKDRGNPVYSAKPATIESTPWSVRKELLMRFARSHSLRTPTTGLPGEITESRS